MSISYMDDVSDGSGIFIFVKILGRWKGSLYKLVWIDLIFYIATYYALNLSYRFAMNDDQRVVFEKIVGFCEKMKANIPISFLLGFFVAGVIARWYQMYLYIPWMNHIAFIIQSSIGDKDPTVARKIRLSLMRYMNLAWILVMRRVSDQIMARFRAHDDDEGGDPIESVSGAHQKRVGVAGQHGIGFINKSSNQKLRRSDCTLWAEAKVPSDAEKRRSRNIPVSNQTNFAQLNRMQSVRNPSVQPNSQNSELLPKSLITEKRGTIISSSSADILEDGGEYGAVGNMYDSEYPNHIRRTLQSFNDDPKVRNTFGKLITSSEITAFEEVARQCFHRNRTKYTLEYWIPMQWACRLVLKAAQSGYISDPKVAFIVIEHIGRLRTQMQDLQVYSSIMIPLVYTQVVIIAVYSYFLCQIFASQFVQNNISYKHSYKNVYRVDFYFPIFSIFSFLFLMGWLKVALCVMNPFGDDDEDFQTSDILDYNLEVSYRSVFLDEATFPNHMSMPIGKGSEAKNNPADLLDYLNQIDEELQGRPADAPMEDMANLIVKPSIITRTKNLICCNQSEQYNSPKDKSADMIALDCQFIDQNNDDVHVSQKKWDWM